MNAIYPRIFLAEKKTEFQMSIRRWSNLCPIVELGGGKWMARKSIRGMRREGEKWANEKAGKTEAGKVALGKVERFVRYTVSRLKNDF